MLIGAAARAVAARLHPLRVVPHVIAVAHARRGARRRLRGERHRIALLYGGAGSVRDGVLVQRTGSDAHDEGLPDPGRAVRPQPVPVTLPAVPVADHCYGGGVGSPDREVRAVTCCGPGRPGGAGPHRMRAELTVQALMGALAKEMRVVAREQRESRIGRHGHRPSTGRRRSSTRAVNHRAPPERRRASALTTSRRSSLAQADAANGPAAKNGVRSGHAPRVPGGVRRERRTPRTPLPRENLAPPRRAQSRGGLESPCYSGGPWPRCSPPGPA